MSSDFYDENFQDIFLKSDDRDRVKVYVWKNIFGAAVSYILILSNGD